jgi:large subunit ribosomal protein L5
MAARLKERYERDVKPKLIQRFGYTSPMQAPRLEKITLNMGIGEAKVNTAILDAATEQLGVIAGQKPAIRRARKSIANFKLRAGMPVGVMVTLRGERMYEMLDRLQSIAIPRVRDFRGLNPRSFDGRGNYSLGIREQIIFPEVDYDSIDEVRGLDVAITTTASSDEEGYELLRMMGMPFRREEAPGRSAEAPEEPAEDQPALEPSTEAAGTAEAEPGPAPPTEQGSAEE